MGYARRRPKRMGKKLEQIREHLGWTQRELVEELGVNIPNGYLSKVEWISKFELNTDEPDILTLLAYARLVNVPLEQLVDDELDLTL